jgi:hypothetical protein
VLSCLSTLSRARPAGASSGPCAIRGALPASSRPATVRHSSSTASAAMRAPNSDGPPSLVQSTEGERHVERVVARHDHVGESVEPGEPFGGGPRGRDDHRARGRIREYRRRGVEVEGSGDDREHRMRRKPALLAPPRALSADPQRAVALRPDGARPDQHDVAHPPQQFEQALVRGVAQPAREARRGRGTVDARYEVHAQPRTGRHGEVGDELVVAEIVHGFRPELVDARGHSPMLWRR